MYFFTMTSGAPAHRGNEVAVGPQRRQAGPQPRKFVAQHPRRAPLQQFHQPVNAELRVAIDEQVDVIRHDFLFEDYRIPFPAYLREDRLEPVIHAGDQHLPAVLRAPDDVEFAVKGHVVVAARAKLYRIGCYNVQAP